MDLFSTGFGLGDLNFLCPALYLKGWFLYFSGISRWFRARNFLDYPVHHIARHGSRVVAPGFESQLMVVGKSLLFELQFSCVKMGMMIGPPYQAVMRIK